MPKYDSEVVILGRREFTEAMRNLPGRVVQKIMDAWTLKQAQNMAKIARAYAPRDKRKPRNKPESARLWRAIRASKVKKVKAFPNTVSRSIAYGASSNNRTINRPSFRKKLTSRFEKKSSRGAKFGPTAPRARHFHLAVLGTKPRIQYSTGRRTGSMWGATANPNFWTKAQNGALAVANGEVGAQLRDAYDRGIQAELKRLERKYL